MNVYLFIYPIGKPTVAQLIQLSLEEKNKVRGEEAIISADDSRVKVVVIPADEELMIATDTMNLL